MSRAIFVVTSGVGVFGRRWRWVLRAANGEVVAVSQAYKHRQSAIEGAEAVARVAGHANVVPDQTA